MTDLKMKYESTRLTSVIEFLTLHPQFGEIQDNEGGVLTYTVHLKDIPWEISISITGKSKNDHRGRRLVNGHGNVLVDNILYVGTPTDDADRVELIQYLQPLFDYIRSL